MRVRRLRNHITAGTAYFDVDHTVTRVGSLESFIRFYAHGTHGSLVAGRLPRLLDFAAKSSDVGAIHQAYAKAFRGESWQQLLSAGTEWYEAVSADLFRGRLVEEVQRHHSSGNEVVFVSGSWAPCLQPIARQLGVSTVLQSQPSLEDDEDTLSGSFKLVMIGEQKAVAVRQHAAAFKVDLLHAYAYGDHRTDEPLLRAVGKPIVVGEDAHLRLIASANSWRVIPTDSSSS